MSHFDILFSDWHTLTSNILLSDAVSAAVFTSWPFHNKQNHLIVPIHHIINPYKCFYVITTFPVSNIYSCLDIWRHVHLMIGVMWNALFIPKCDWTDWVMAQHGQQLSVYCSLSLTCKKSFLFRKVLGRKLKNIRATTHKSYTAYISRLIWLTVGGDRQFWSQIKVQMELGCVKNQCNIAVPLQSSSKQTWHWTGCL